MLGALIFVAKIFHQQHIDPPKYQKLSADIRHTPKKSMKIYIFENFENNWKIKNYLSDGQIVPNVRTYLIFF